LEIAQTQPGDLYRLPLQVAIGAAGAVKVTSVLLTVRNTIIKIPSDKQPQSVTLDPETQVLMDARLVKR